MKFYTWYVVSLFMVVQIIAGCGGGGGGSSGVPPVTTDTAAPTVTSFTMPPTSSTMTVGISSFSAFDAVGVTGYMVTESATAPAASASGWFSSVPASFTFTSTGPKTAYAWAKDAAGNVSISLSATTTISLVDTIAPTISNFALPSSSTSLTVPISNLTVADNVGVKGYFITESASVPAASASGWSASAPTNFTFSSAGTKTAYAWAKDAAGNVSTSSQATILITLPTTKSATLKFYSQSSNSSELISGFYLTVTLPVGSVLPVDSSGVPLSSAVYLSGQFAVGPPPLCTITYDSVSRTLTVNPASTNEYRLGEFTTVIINVPYSYEPKASDVIMSFTAWSPSGIQSVAATATFTFI